LTMGANMHFLETEQLLLRGLQASDADGPYHKWMNDAEITQYLESRYVPHSPEDLRRFIDRKGDEKNLFLALCLKNQGTHIGNIKLGPIDFIHRRADIGILIGDRAQWGKGLATEAISALSGFAFNELNLHKLTAGCYTPNIGSAKAFERAGFTREAVLKNHNFSGGQWIDCILLAKFNGR